MKDFFSQKSTEPSCIIPHQTARQWLAQCEYLLATVKENEARETREHDLARANGTCKQCLEKEKLERVR